MNHKQIAKIGMYKKLYIFFADTNYSVFWANFQRLKDEIADFVTLNDSLPDYIQQQALDTKGITTGKDDAFNELVKLAVNKAYKGYVWAVDAANAELAETFDVHKDDFIHIPESKAFAKLENIRKALSNNIASMASVNLSAADITAIDNAVSAYKQFAGTPGVAKDKKKAGTQGIDDLIHPIDQSLELITRLIMSEYSNTQPDMVKEFLTHRHIDDLPTYHSGLSAHITGEKDEDLAKAIIAVEGTGKTATSDINGLAEIIKIKSGTYNVTVSLAGYETKTEKLVIKRGKITELTVKLKKN